MFVSLFKLRRIYEGKSGASDCDDRSESPWNSQRFVASLLAHSHL